MLSVQTPLRRFLALLACAIAGVAGVKPCAAASGWSISISPDDALYPVLDLSQRAGRPGEARYGDGSGMIAVEVTAQSANEAVHLSVSTAALAEPAVVDAVLPRAGERYTLRPRLRWSRSALARIATPQNTVVEFRLQRGAAAAEVQRREIRLHPLSEALYYVRDGKDHVDLGWIFAAYADPNSHVIDRILQEASERHPFLSLKPGPRTPAQTTAAVYAVWEVLQLHGVRYADEDPGLARGPLVWSQHVRLHDDVWEERRANCIDGSLLLAAALERLGIRSVLLLVPRHALLAFHTDARKSSPVFVETTLLGARQLAVRPRPGFVNELSLIDSDALESFSAALVAGQARYAREAAGFGQKKPDYQWIDLATARAYGIIPLAAPGAAVAAAGQSR
ncbi:hypothetical protein [Tahibacter harae]|uniref:hypothetical protein n=1 Tax=Tahibacter harae TaxID=2963937 RepID=UPI00210CE77A|nr:hypothetical protein [Tahibacter harae]